MKKRKTEGKCLKAFPLCEIWVIGSEKYILENKMSEIKHLTSKNILDLTKIYMKCR